MTNKFCKLFSISWLLILITLCFTIFPYHDSFYYWTWSQHLQLSYYDGPPLIAYIIKASTLIFGNTVFAINIVGVIFAYLAAYYVYKLALLMSKDIKVARLSFVMYLVYPFVTTRFIYINMTYDCLENLFYVMITYYVVLFLNSRNYKLWILIGALSGLAMLSKYSGIVLFMGLFVYFIIDAKERKLFTRYELYTGIILCLILFTPVIYWNYQNGWESFLYQLNSHKWTGEPGSINSRTKHGFPGVWFYLANCMLATFHILIAFLLFFKIKYESKIIESNAEKLLVTIFVVFFLFWLYISYGSHVGLNYALPILFIPIYFCAKLFVKYDLGRAQVVFISLFAIISIGMMIDHSRLKSGDELNYNRYIVTDMVKQPLNIWH
ncbi:MAG: glycosyltransferase family 39 protein [Burkholderiales bacterium]|nr:glycosyltransferase family 39 protein [Burkholderiales bacterium]